MAGIFDDASLAELRNLIAGGMTARAKIETPSNVRGPGGTTTTTWAAGTRTAVPCSFRPAGQPDEQIGPAAEQAVAQYVLDFPVGTVVTPRDRITITHDEPGVPKPFVLDVIGPVYRTDEISRRILARRSS